jgi:hypothetical protein
MARHNKDAVKQPELKPLPELPAKEEAKPADAAAPPAEPAPAETRPADAAAARPADGTAADAAKADEAKGEAEAPAETPPAETPPAATDDAKKAEETPQAEDAKKADETKDEPKKDEAPPADAAAEKEKEREKIMAERKSIEDENQRKNTEYQELIKKGEEKVKELNLRFGDWYFVVDDSVFKKLRLGRNDVIKKKEPPKTEGAAAPGATNPSPPADATPAGLPAIPGASE